MNEQDSSSGSVKQLSDPYILLFSLTLFLSAALTFTIQPMVGKLLLPLVGGAPSGWLVTMVYFQIALLGGYAVAHVLSRASVVTHVLVVLGFLITGLSVFPLHIDAGIIEKSSLPEAFSVFQTLATALTLPCIALFTLSPTLQRLFEAGSGNPPKDPYFLFAASNFGSLGGLLAYPLVIERVAGLSTQTHVWEQKYKVLLALCVACLAYAYHQIRSKPQDVADITAPSIGWRTRGWWVLLAFIPSSMMLGVTSYITIDSGSVPFFWVLPLSLYLLTFILAFKDRQPFALLTLDFLQTAGIAVMVAFLIRGAGMVVSGPQYIAFALAAFFLTALFCHFTLAQARPSSQRLTEFYLWVAIGGALGGIFNTFVAPFIFPLPHEFALVALISCLIHPRRPGIENSKIDRLVIGGAVVAAISAALYALYPFRDAVLDKVLDVSTLAAFLVSLLIVSLKPKFLALLSLGLVVFAFSVPQGWKLLDVHRGFLGVLRVVDFPKPDTDIVVRAIFHGSTLHGMEQVKPEILTAPNGYYRGALNNLFDQFKPADVAIVGLGAGTILCHTAPGRHFTVYEIDPAVPVFAEKWFSFIHDCGKPDIHIGDGRRLLAAETAPPHDMLIIDAFTSDAIPLHLLTTEAFALYFDRLKPDGILAIHISNRFYDLRQPISNAVSWLGFHALYITFRPESSPVLTFPSRWVVVARNEAQLEPLRKLGWVDLPPPQGHAWTDDFSDALSALNILQPKEHAHAQTH